MKKITLLFTLLMASVWHTHAQFPAPYCGPITFSNNEEPITLVQFAGINNSSPAPTGQEAHQNFTSIVGTVMQGISYPITLKGNTDGNWTTYLRVFIDWNHNNVFTDANESYDIGTITNSTGLDAVTLTGNIAVPAGATLGNTRMRVVKKYFEYSDSCNTPGTGFGEAEDYTLNVVTASCTPPTVNIDVSSLCPAASFNVVVNLTMGSAASYSVNDNQQSPTQTISANGQLTFGPYASGTQVQITITDQSASLCNVTSEMLTDICLPGCSTTSSPANGAVNVPAGPITLTWDVPTGGTPDHYDLYVGDTADTLEYFDSYDTNTTGDNLVINAYGVTIYWGIVAVNAAGEAQGCTTWSFTVQSPPGYCLTAPFSLYPADTYTPEACDGVTVNTIVDNGYAGEYSNVNVTSGQTYTFSSGSTDFITIGNEAGTEALAYGETPLTWVSTVTGVVRFYSHIDDQCGTEAVDRTRSIVCGIATNDTPDYANMQWPPNAQIPQGNTFNVYGQVYEANLTEPAGQAAGIEAWVGINDADTNPNTWQVTWVPMTFNASATNTGNNDEYMASVGAALMPGSYYYAVRWRLNNGPFVYGGINTDGTAGNFWDGTTYGNGELTVTDPVVPENDLCSGAIALTPGGVFDDNDVTGQLLGATTTTGLTFNCQTNRDSDVWYSVQVPASGSITIATEAAPGSPLYDTVLSVFSGTCGALTEIGCSDDEGTGAFSTITLGQQTPGATLYIGVWRWTNDTNLLGAFRVSAFDASLTTGEVSLDGFSYYPNPVTSVLNVKAHSGIQSVSVFNMLGQQVLQRNVNAEQGTIDMSSLAKGAYIVKLNSESASKSIKIIKE